MYSDCVASSSRHPLHDPWGPPSDFFSFPTSSIRHEARSPQRATILPSLSSLCTPAPPYTTFSTKVPQRVQISPGLWFDGKDTVLGAALPEVQRVLAVARNTLKLSAIASDVVFALAALHVFYNPGDPAHWLFWSDEHKNRTAEVVTRISLHNPPLIISPVAWNGTPEYLAILANHHGSTWRHVFETKPWFAILVPPKVPTPVRVPNLRKRKVAPGAFREPSKSPAIDDSEEGDEPPPKRVRPKQRATPERADSVGCTNESVEEENAQTKSNRAKGNRSKVSPASCLPLNQSPDATPASHPEAIIEDDAPIDEFQATKRASTRKRRKVSPASRYPQAISSREASSSLGETLLLLNPSHSTSPSDSPSPSHSRNRSTSEASAKTAVESDERRSMSVLSAVTAVEVLGSQKRKPTPVSEEAKELEDGTPPLDSEEGMVTRGRALRARPKITHVDPTLDECVQTKSDKATGKTARARRAKV